MGIEKVPAVRVGSGGTDAANDESNLRSTPMRTIHAYGMIDDVRDANRKCVKTASSFVVPGLMNDMDVVMHLFRHHHGRPPRLGLAGADVGLFVGVRVGIFVGVRVGGVTGARVGVIVGVRVGGLTGARVGVIVGLRDGGLTGARVGFGVGARTGVPFGLLQFVGAFVTR
jgi:hypothetical protein